MQLSRYEQNFRQEVTKSVNNAFEKWYRMEGMKQKEKKRSNWCKQGIFDSVPFVHATADGKQKKIYHYAIRNSGL